MRNIEPRYPEWRHTTPVLLDAECVRKAEACVTACESCAPDQSEVPFDYVLDCVTGCDPEYTDYVLSESARCPACGMVMRTGYWRWSTSEEEGRTVFLLPGTLVVMKNQNR
jgi:hypothetical protein